jgi:hypothetical protein
MNNSGRWASGLQGQGKSPKLAVSLCAKVSLAAGNSGCESGRLAVEPMEVAGSAFDLLGEKRQQLQSSWRTGRRLSSSRTVRHWGID